MSKPNQETKATLVRMDPQDKALAEKGLKYQGLALEQVLKLAINDPMAQYTAAVNYGIRGHHELEKEMYERSMAHGLPDSIYNLAIMYYLKQAIPQDMTEEERIAKMIELYELAVEKRHAKACNNLALIYLKGQYGVTKDTAHAIELYELSASLGYEDAQRMMTIIKGQAGDTDKASEYHDLYYNNNPNAHYNLGLIFIKEGKIKLAYNHLELAAEAGLEQAKAEFAKIQQFCADIELLKEVQKFSDTEESWREILKDNDSIRQTQTKISSYIQASNRCVEYLKDLKNRSLELNKTCNEYQIIINSRTAAGELQKKFKEKVTAHTKERKEAEAKEAERKEAEAKETAAKEAAIKEASEKLANTIKLAIKEIANPTAQEEGRGEETEAAETKTVPTKEVEDKPQKTILKRHKKPLTAAFSEDKIKKLTTVIGKYFINGYFSPQTNARIEDPREAVIDLIRNSISDDPQNPIIQLRAQEELGSLYELLEDFKETERLYKLSSNKNWRPAKCKLGILYASQKDFKKAQIIFESFVDSEPFDALVITAQVHLGKFYSGHGGFGINADYKKSYLYLKSVIDNYTTKMEGVPLPLDIMPKFITVKVDWKREYKNSIRLLENPLTNGLSKANIALYLKCRDYIKINEDAKPTDQELSILEKIYRMSLEILNDPQIQLKLKFKEELYEICAEYIKTNPERINPGDQEKLRVAQDIINKEKSPQVVAVKNLESKAESKTEEKSAEPIKVRILHEKRPEYKIITAFLLGQELNPKKLNGVKFTMEEISDSQKSQYGFDELSQKNQELLRNLFKQLLPDNLMNVDQLESFLAKNGESLINEIINLGSNNVETVLQLIRTRNNEFHSVNQTLENKSDQTEFSHPAQDLFIDGLLFETFGDHETALQKYDEAHKLILNSLNKNKDKFDSLKEMELRYSICKNTLQLLEKSSKEGAHDEKIAARKKKLEKEIKFTLNQLGLIYFNRGDMKMAKSYFQSSKDLGYDQATANLEKINKSNPEELISLTGLLMTKDEKEQKIAKQKKSFKTNKKAVIETKSESKSEENRYKVELEKFDEEFDAQEPQVITNKFLERKLFSALLIYNKAERNDELLKNALKYLLFSKNSGDIDKLASYLTRWERELSKKINNLNPELTKEERAEEISKLIEQDEVIISINKKISTQHKNHSTAQNYFVDALFYEIIGDKEKTFAALKKTNEKIQEVGLKKDLGNLLFRNSIYQKTSGFYLTNVESSHIKGDNSSTTCHLKIDGNSVRIDDEDNFTSYLENNKKDIAYTQRELGLHYYEQSKDKTKDLRKRKQNLRKAIQYFEAAAVKNDEEAQYRLGYIYYKGIGVKKDLAKAEKWLGLAALEPYKMLPDKKGHPKAQYLMGIIHYHRIEAGQTEADYEEAANFFRLAANRGHKKSRHILMLMYYGNVGVRQNFLRAENLLESIEKENLIDKEKADILKEAAKQRQHASTSKINSPEEFNEVLGLLEETIAKFHKIDKSNLRKIDGLYNKVLINLYNQTIKDLCKSSDNYCKENNSNNERFEQIKSDIKALESREETKEIAELPKTESEKRRERKEQVDERKKEEERKAETNLVKELEEKHRQDTQKPKKVYPSYRYTKGSLSQAEPYEETTTIHIRQGIKYNPDSAPDVKDGVDPLLNAQAIATLENSNKETHGLYERAMQYDRLYLKQLYNSNDPRLQDYRNLELPSTRLLAGKDISNFNLSEIDPHRKTPQEKGLEIEEEEKGEFNRSSTKPKDSTAEADSTPPSPTISMQCLGKLTDGDKKEVIII